MPAILVAASVVLGAVWRRWYGGWLPGTAWKPLSLTLAWVFSAGVLYWGGVEHWRAALAGVIFAYGWTPGHGSYMQPLRAQGVPDNEGLRHVLAILPLEHMGTAYKIIGMSVRYGWVSVAVALASGVWWYAPAGFVAGLSYILCSAVAGQPQQDRLPGGFTAWAEALLGAVMFGAVAWVAL